MKAITLQHYGQPEDLKLVEHPDPAGLTALGELADAGRLAVHVERVLPLAQAAEAWRISREGRVRGKLVLSVG